MLSRADHERLKEILEELGTLHHEAKRLVRSAGKEYTFEINRANAYWIAMMDNALSGGRLAGCDMEETIASLDPGDFEDEELEDEELEDEEEEG